MPAGNRTNNVDATQFTRQGSRFFGEPLHKNVARSQLAVKVCIQDKTMNYELLQRDRSLIVIVQSSAVWNLEASGAPAQKIATCHTCAPGARGSS